MAVRAVTQVTRDDGMVVWTWAALNEVGGTLDTGAPVVPGNVDGLTVQGTGNYDTNAVVTMQGSNDGTNWFAIGSGTLVAATNFRTIAERPLYIRPAVTTVGAGDATAVVVVMVGARTQR
jgi:hypothetical protein